MLNVLGVWSASAGLGVLVWGVSGSVRWSAAAVGLLLLAASVALLVDVGDDT